MLHSARLSIALHQKQCQQKELRGKLRQLEGSAFALLDSGLMQNTQVKSASASLRQL